MTRRRPGITMAEVLVALFIMALGAIAILSMFPLGVLTMGQALKDDRTAQAANQADAYLRWYWKTYVAETSTPDPFVTAFDNPGGLAAPPINEPSYPVVLDPLGWVVWPGGGTQTQVASTLMPRRTTSTLSGVTGPVPNGVVLRFTTLLDGLTYDQAGQAADSNGNVGGGPIDRDIRYNWLWVLQRPVSGTNPKTATMTVVVFDRRAPFYQAPNGENAYGVIGLVGPGQTAVTIDYTNKARPDVLKGGWIMDGTILGAPYSVRHANFYRVVGVTDGPPGSNTVTYDLQTPIRRTDGQAIPYPATIIVMAGISEVFERPNLTGTEVPP